MPKKSANFFDSACKTDLPEMQVAGTSHMIRPNNVFATVCQHAASVLV